MTRTKEQWIEEYKKKGALWMHDGNPKRPHARLTSEKHSNGFFNSGLVVTDEALLRDAASDLLKKFVAEGGILLDVYGVVGPETGGTKLAEFMSCEIRNYTSEPCFHASPAKRTEGEVKSMVFKAIEEVLLPESPVLLCDDVLTTSGSVTLTATAVANAGGIVMPFILVLVNRSSLTVVEGKKIIALIDHPMPMWTAEECPLCKQGSEAIRPKGKEEWALLNAVL